MSRRTTAVALGLAAAAAGGALLMPSDGSQANWYDKKVTTAPALRMGTASFTATDRPVVGPATLRATLTNTSGFGLEFAPTSLVFGPRANTPSSGDAQAAKFTNYNGGVAYDYSTNCADSATARWTIPLTPSSSATRSYSIASPTPPRDPLLRSTSSDLCLTIRPDMVDNDRYRLFAGREFTATTRVDAVSVASTWTATRSWTSRYVVGVPAPLDPAQYEPCADQRIADNVTVVWGWPDAATDNSGTSTPAINRWEVWARPRNGTAADFKFIVSVPSGDRNQNVGVNEMWKGGGFGNGQYDFVVRAFPFADSTHYVESALIYRATLSNVGGLHVTGTWACEPAVTNPDAGTMHGY